MKTIALSLVFGSLTLAASAAEDWDLAWKKIEPYTGRSASVTKSVTSSTPADGRGKTWFDSVLGALDTFGLGALLFLR